MQDETTTDIHVLKTNRWVKFTWGRVVKIHEIGSLAIVEYMAEKEMPRFHVYVDTKDTSVSASSLDEALVYGIAHAHGDPAAARYACRILGVS